MKNHFLLFALTIGIVSTSCRKEPEPVRESVPSQVFIWNEGLFPSGMGTISTYNPSNKNVEHNIFSKANQYYAGPVVQHVLVDGDRTFIVVNQAGTVYVVNTNTFEVQDKFEGFESPRRIAKVADDKYFISDWGINGVHVLNMRSRSITKTLSTGNGPEQMLATDSLVFIANGGGFSGGAIQYDSTVTVYHAYADTIVDTLFVGSNPNGLALDDENRLWILSAGIEDFSNPTFSTYGDLRVYNIDSTRFEDTLVFADNQLRPARLVINRDKDALYFLEQAHAGSILRHDLKDSILTESPYIQGSFYSLGYDEEEGELYGGSANDFTSNGTIRRFTEDGNLVHTFPAGIIPGGFAFK